MTLTMKAAVYTQYGSPEVLHLKTINQPTPKDNEVLVKIHATAVSSGDCRLRSANPFAVRFIYGLFKPKKQILGGVLSGEITAIGKNVQQFKVGDQVFGSTTMDFGAYTEYISLPENGAIAIKPANITHQEAAALPFGGVTALHFLQQAHIQPGQKVLVYGASGAVGTAAVQIAKYLGAEVTGVCSTANVDLVKSLGADKVIDYTKDDFSKNAGYYDVVYETVNKVPVSVCIAALKPKGTLILGAAMLTENLQGMWAAITRGLKLIPGVAIPKAEHALFMQKMVMEGKLKSVIDSEFPLDQIAAAHQRVDSGHKKGNVVIRVV